MRFHEKGTFKTFISVYNIQQLGSTERVKPSAKNGAATWRIQKRTLLHRQVVAPFALAKKVESFKAILDPDADPDHHQNLIASKSGEV